MNAHPTPNAVAIAALFLGMVTAVAQEAPRLLPFQGRLTDANGNSFTDGARLIQFQIYDQPSAGQVLWPGEVHRATMNNGLINVVLGTKNPLPTEQSGNPAKSFFDQPLYLQITVDANGDQQITTADPPLLPRQVILPVIFAREAAVARLANNSANSAKLAGYDWSAIFGINNPALAIPGSRLALESIRGDQIASNTITTSLLARDLQQILWRLQGQAVEQKLANLALPVDEANLLTDLQLLRGLVGTNWGTSSYDKPRAYWNALQTNGFPFTGVEGVAPSIGMRMIYVAAGKYTMGSPVGETERAQDEGPQTQVTLSRGFWLGKYEVTQTQYLVVMGTNPSRFWEDLSRPVEQVYWYDATNYCAQLTERERAAGRLPAGDEYRLPTEGQWEYACRAGTTGRVSFGDDPGYAQLGNYAYYEKNSGVNGGNANSSTHPVGQKQPNPWGFHDMYGNVMEWCLDWYAGSLRGGSVIDPPGAVEGSYRVVRGGSWYYAGALCRSADRDWVFPGGQSYALGFRLALIAVP